MIETKIKTTDPPITSEMLAQWDSELSEFFAETRSKLRALLEASASAPPTDASETSTTCADEPWRASDSNLADESLDRLQQVKRRLAARLQKSRSIEQVHDQAHETDARPRPL